MRVLVAGTVDEKMPSSSVFPSRANASALFEMGSLGYSNTHTVGRFDGFELCCKDWQVEPLAAERITSTYFEDESRFPLRSAEFDCALLMRGVRHEWHGREDLCCPATSKVSPTVKLSGRIERSLNSRFANCGALKPNLLGVPFKEEFLFSKGATQKSAHNGKEARPRSLKGRESNERNSKIGTAGKGKRKIPMS